MGRLDPVSCDAAGHTCNFRSERFDWSRLKCLLRYHARHKVSELQCDAASIFCRPRATLVAVPAGIESEVHVGTAAVAGSAVRPPRHSLHLKPSIVE